MIHLEKILSQHAANAMTSLYGATPDAGLLQIQETRKEFEGNYTLVVFPLLKISKQSPEATAKAIGDYMQANCPEVDRYNVIKGFLNLVISNTFWLKFIEEEAPPQPSPKGRVGVGLWVALLKTSTKKCPKSQDSGSL